MNQTIPVEEDLGFRPRADRHRAGEPLLPARTEGFFMIHPQVATGAQDTGRRLTHTLFTRPATRAVVMCVAAMVVSTNVRAQEEEGDDETSPSRTAPPLFQTVVVAPRPAVERPQEDAAASSGVTVTVRWPSNQQVSSHPNAPPPPPPQRHRGRG